MMSRPGPRSNMENLQRTLDQLRPCGDAESDWLKEIFTFITEHLHPLLSYPASSGSPDQLTVSVVKTITDNMAVSHSLPVSYRPVSVSELISNQHLACVSNLSWSTNQQRAWEKEAELVMPDHKALPRVNLLLIGCLREGRGGAWMLTDSSGAVRCESLSPSLSWLNQPVFLPHWNYIPHDATGQDTEEAAGWVELVVSPVLLSPGPEQGLAAGPGEGVVGVRQAAGVLKTRTRGRRVSVWGTVDSVCPLLVVSGTSFFVFTLTDHSHSLPVLVKVSSRLWWLQVLRVGQSVCVTALRVCILRGWRGNNILCVTEHSELHTNYTQTQHTDSELHTDYTQTQHTDSELHTNYTQTQHTDSELHTNYTQTQHTDSEPHTNYTQTHTDSELHTHDTQTQHTDSELHTNYTQTQHTDSELHTNNQQTQHTDSELHINYTQTQLDTPTPQMMSQQEDESCEEADPDEDAIQSGARMKQSKVISYQGTVTEVISEGAGLYVLDRKVGLCLAYQPSLRRKLRPGDMVELHHVHFLFRPCPDFTPSMLCACLRSSITVTSFSRVGAWPPDSGCPGDGTLPRLLLETNMGVSEYLWACHLSSKLTRSLLPHVLKQSCVCLLSWRLVEDVMGRGGQGRRDIYSEMLDEPHTCPLSQYRVDSWVPQYFGVLDLCETLQSESWSSLSLSSLLPPGGLSLNSSEINSALAWSYRILDSDPQNRSLSGDTLRQRPLLLVGVLELPPQRSEHCLQLRDRTGGVACVATESNQEEEGCQTAVFNTAWIGCLVCVTNFTMVTERFIQSDFPSYQHLDQDRFISHRHSRVYLEFSLDHLYILSPSVAMVTYLRQKKAESADGVRRNQSGISKDNNETESKKTKQEVTADSTQCTSTFVSMVIRVEQKEGVAWKNVGAELQDGEAGLTPSFSITAAVIGAAVTWGWDPKNNPMTAGEADSKRIDKLVLVFSGVSARWFPVLQSGVFYRVVVPNTQDQGVFSSCGVSGRSQVEVHTEPTLQVKSDWRFHTLAHPLLMHTCRQAPSPTVLSVSDVISCRSELVSFQALLSDRISLRGTHLPGPQHTGVRLTVCDQTGYSLQLYLDLSHTPYPPGLLPGNTVLFSALQRKVSRSGGVYCRYLPVSSVTVIAVGGASVMPSPSAPMMHLGLWAASGQQRCIVGQIRGHVVCFLFLQLQWSCSSCGSVYTQTCSSPQCPSTATRFESRAKLVMDDGTGEAHVAFSGALVRPLLGLADSQWEGLQRAVRVRGLVRVSPKGRSPVSESNDYLLHFLLSMCSSDAVTRQLSLTCRRTTNQRAEEMKRFSRGDRDFITRVTPPLQLTCLHIHPD